MPPHPLMFERHDVLPYATLAFGLLRAILAIAATSLLTLLPHNINPAFLILAGACRVYVKLVYLLKEPDYGVVEEIVGLGDWADDDWVWDEFDHGVQVIRYPWPQRVRLVMVQGRCKSWRAAGDIFPYGHRWRPPDGATYCHFDRLIE